MGLFESSNAFVFVTAIALVAVLAIAIERMFTLYFLYRLKVQAFKKHLEATLREKDITKALRLSELNPRHPVCLTAKAGLLRAEAPVHERQSAMEAAALESYPRVKGHTEFLAMLGSIGTLLGLIGTVTGMIDAFGGVGSADTMAKQELLARGISVALQSTALGLAVAIPAFFLYTLFSHRQERLLDHTEEIAATVSAGLSKNDRENERFAEAS